MGLVDVRTQRYQLSSNRLLCGHNISDVCTKQIAELEQDRPLGLTLVLPLNPLFRVVGAQHNVSGTAVFVHLGHIFNGIQVLVHLVHHGEGTTNLGIDQMVEPAAGISKRAHSH